MNAESRAIGHARRTALHQAIRYLIVATGIAIFAILVVAWMAGDAARAETRATVDLNTGKAYWSYRPSGGHHVIRRGSRLGDRTIQRTLPDGSHETTTEPLYEPTTCPRGMKVLRYGQWGC